VGEGISVGTGVTVGAGVGVPRPGKGIPGMPGNGDGIGMPGIMVGPGTGIRPTGVGKGIPGCMVGNSGNAVGNMPYPPSGLAA
jgi:hypothetical protein